MTSPMTRRSVLASTAALTTAAALASCGADDDGNEVQEKIDNPGDNINAEGLPIVEEQVTLTFMSGRGPTTAEDWNEVGCLKEAEKLPKITFTFDLAPSDGGGEKRNLALTSGDYQEDFYLTGFPAGAIERYGKKAQLV